ncbi:MAG: hypothetical protein EZS28_026483 [Streblomastix strix]|uniref:Uncharacterized protein n=1 Tax=Streblomastix strix TaxID=222440 RepID=A0A5J4V583_9EUKA|nr:MAG: hypothetical protein EZS28_026483 [Streblomastix strix]
MSKDQEIIEAVAAYDSKKQNQQYPIVDSLSLLHDILLGNPDNCKQAAYTPKVLISLIKLSLCKHIKDFDREEKKETDKVRNFSLCCLQEIQRLGDLSVQYDLIEKGYIRALIHAASLCGGSSMQNDIWVFVKLQSTFQIYRDLNDGRIQQTFNQKFASFAPQSYLTDCVKDQIELEGGNEEVDALIFNIGWFNKVKDIASNLKYFLTVTGKDCTNREWDQF